MILRILFITFLCFLIVGCDPDKTSIPSDLKIGDQIVEALGKYQREHRRFPDDLSALTPEYLPAIQNPEYGKKKWDYVHYSDESFGLFLWGKQRYHDAYMYNATLGKWEVVKNSF